MLLIVSTATEHSLVPAAPGAFSGHSRLSAPSHQHLTPVIRSRRLSFSPVCCLTIPITALLDLTSTDPQVTAAGSEPVSPSVLDLLVSFPDPTAKVILLRHKPGPLLLLLTLSPLPPSYS